MHLCSRRSNYDVTRINFRFRHLVMWSSSHGLGASSHQLIKIGPVVLPLWVVENHPFPWPLAYTTACTTVQAVDISKAWCATLAKTWLTRQQRRRPYQNLPTNVTHGTVRDVQRSTTKVSFSISARKLNQSHVAKTYFEWYLLNESGTAKRGAILDELWWIYRVRVRPHLLHVWFTTKFSIPILADTTTFFRQRAGKPEGKIAHLSWQPY